MSSPTTAELLLEWDKRRARSQQLELGMSELGGCQRRAGYRLRGDEPTNQGGSVQAVMGTAVHAAVESAFHAMQAAGLIPAEDLVEYEVRFAGVLGHLDRYESEDATIRDTKTTTQQWLDHIRIYGADRDHIWQTHLYGAAVMRTGRPVRKIVIDYLARDTGKDHQVEMPFETRHVRDALEWLDAVKSVEPERLNRAYAPDTSFCGHCPFFAKCWEGHVPDRDERSVILVEDEDAAGWAERLWQARRDEADGKRRAAEAKGVLDGLRTNTAGKGDPIVIDGFEKALQFVVRKPKRVDNDQVKRDYDAAGGKPPMIEGHEVRLNFVPIPERTDQ